MNNSKVLVAPKKMEYSVSSISSEVLYLEISGDGYGICIVNIRHSHPCGYVTFPGIDKVKSYDDFYVKNAMVHGGFTFLGKLNPVLWKDLDVYAPGFIWIGWDYGHLYDSEWTTEEVLNEARAIIDDIRAGEYGYDEEDIKNTISIFMPEQLSNIEIAIGVVAMFVGKYDWGITNNPNREFTKEEVVYDDGKMIISVCENDECDCDPDDVDADYYLPRFIKVIGLSNEDFINLYEIYDYMRGC